MTLVTIGLIQDAVTGDQTQTLTATIARIREAAGRGAQIICLKELFNAPYFCKSLKQEYFNFAEPTGRAHGWKGSFAAGVDFRSIHPELCATPEPGDDPHALQRL